MFAGLFALFRDSVVARLSHEGCGIARREALRRSSCKSSTLGAEKFGAFINFLLARRRASLLFDARKLGRAADFVGLRLPCPRRNLLVRRHRLFFT